MKLFYIIFLAALIASGRLDYQAITDCQHHNQPKACLAAHGIK